MMTLVLNTVGKSYFIAVLTTFARMMIVSYNVIDLIIAIALIDTVLGTARVVGDVCIGAFAA